MAMRSRAFPLLVLVAACASGNNASSGSAPKPASNVVIERLPDPVDAASFVDVTAALLVPKARPDACKPETPESIERAKERYRRGVQLYDGEDYEGALIEFEREYERCPNVRILYNLALIHVVLNQNAKAHALFEAYLADGRIDPPPERLAEIREHLARIEKKLGWVLVECREGVAHASVDELDLSALGPCPFRRRVRTDAGRRAVAADDAKPLSVEGSATTAVRVAKRGR
jgi:hypothetical protein